MEQHIREWLDRVTADARGSWLIFSTLQYGTPAILAPSDGRNETALAFGLDQLEREGWVFVAHVYPYMFFRRRGP